MAVMPVNHMLNAGYRQIEVNAMLRAHASGGANTPSLYSGFGVSAVHGGSTGKYTLTLAGGSFKKLVNIFVQIHANSHDAVDSWVAYADIDSWSGSAGTIDVWVENVTTDADLPADTYLSVRAVLSDSALDGGV